MKILYKLVFESRPEMEFEVDISREYSEPENLPEWTKLEFNQCPNCPLKKETTPYCPAAVEVEQTMAHFKDILSTEVIDAWVIAPDRFYYKKCDAQSALRAMVGLVMATSPCPVLKQMKGLAYFHLPFASLDETIYRGACNYFMKQYYKMKAGETPDWGLEHYGKYYDELSKVNTSFFERIKVASKADSNLNTIVSLSSVSSLHSAAIEEYMEQFREFFEGQ